MRIALAGQAELAPLLQSSPWQTHSSILRPLTSPLRSQEGRFVRCKVERVPDPIRRSESPQEKVGGSPEMVSETVIDRQSHTLWPFLRRLLLLHVLTFSEQLVGFSSGAVPK